MVFYTFSKIMVLDVHVFDVGMKKGGLLRVYEQRYCHSR